MPYTTFHLDDPANTTSAVSADNMGMVSEKLEIGTVSSGQQIASWTSVIDSWEGVQAGLTGQTYPIGTA